MHEFNLKNFEFSNQSKFDPSDNIQAYVNIFSSSDLFLTLNLYCAQFEWVLVSATNESMNWQPAELSS